MAVIQSSVMQRFDGAEHYVDGVLRLLQVDRCVRAGWR